MNNRRIFLKQSLAGSAAISLSGAVPNLLLRAAESANQNSEEKILVVIQLTGGNDGLNTVIPFGDDDYYKNRFTLAIAKQSVLKINQYVGFHPALTGFDQLLQDGKLAVVQGVGYPNPNRSHFESMDLWHTAHRITASDRRGWLGRSVEQAFADADLPAVHLGRGLQPLALRNENRPVPTVSSIADFRMNVLRKKNAKAQLEPLINRKSKTENSLLNYVYESSRVAVETSHRLDRINEQKSSKFSYPSSELGQNLSLIAQLIGSGLSTRIYYVTLDGFDTHSNQAAAHRSLLADLSGSVRPFLEQLTAQGDDQRVAVLSFSEFGRRVRENASGGTDHGTAAPVFVFGSAVENGVIGKHPSLTDLDQGDVKFKIDYRQVYAELLDDWLKVDSSTILGDKFEPVGLFS